MANITLFSVMVYLPPYFCRNIQNKINSKRHGSLQKSNLRYLFIITPSQIRLHTFSKQVQFFRKIVLKGDFHEAIQFINTLSANLSEKSYKKSCLTIYKQKLYELIDTPNQKQLINLFEKQIINVCSEQEFQNLFTLLTCRKAQQVQGLMEWTVLKGRLQVFDEILPIIQSAFQSGNKSNQPTLTKIQPQINLDQVIALYLQTKKAVDNKSIRIDQKIEQPAKAIELNVSKNLEFQFNNKSKIGSQIQNFIKSDKKQAELQFSESQYQKSHIIGGFQKKPKLYNNYSNIKQNETQSFIKNQSQPFMKGSQKSSLKQNNFVLGNKNQYSASKLYQQEQINEISEEEQRSDTVRSNNRLEKSRTETVNKFQDQQNSEFQQESSRQNIEYLQQTNSVVYNNQPDRDTENFTFSHHNFGLDAQKPRKILKLSTIYDNKAIRTCQFSSSGSYFALGTNSSILKIFQVEQLFSQNKYKQISPIYEINGLHSKSIFCLDWGKNENSMVTCSNDLTIKLTQFNSYFSSHQVSVIGRHESCIRMVKFSKDQSKIYSCGDDSLVKIWDMGKVKRCYNLKGHSAGISAFKLCEKQNQLFSVSKDSTIKKWDLRTLQCVATSHHQQSQMTFIANNTQRIVASNRSGNVLFFDQNLNLQYEVKVHDEQIRSIQASTSHDLYLTASFDGHVGMFTQKMIHSPDYFQHNQNSEDKVVFATFLSHAQMKGFASTSTLGLCNIYSFT